MAATRQHLLGPLPRPCYSCLMNNENHTPTTSVHTQATLAEHIACQAHAGQTDYQGQPYIDHPQRVAIRCTGDDAKAVAWLHDVLEDTEWTSEQLLKQGISQLVIDAVILVSRVEGEIYRLWIDRLCATEGSAATIARQVKLADLADNMSRPTPAHMKGIVEKRYQPAFAKLHAAIVKCGETLPDVPAG